ncbi:response regulator [Aurantibacillus circumpalustris]|uniref:response regulator n=1 Tax=Aurantibacillus circumpalustris TaxID=3036359 RepID=UPI00295B5765|nr:response regulator [Aurantibacillus circumpalustris]
MEKLNIFIVEDESIVAKDIQNSLTKLGYNVVGFANNGKDAIDKITELMPDLILMDIMIKGPLTGIEVSEKIKEKMNIPVIFLTAYADEGTLSRAKITEPYGYILKPFKEIDLHSTIEMAVYKHQKDSALLKERDFLYSLVENKDEKAKDILFVKSNSRLVKVYLKDIYFVEALKDYVIINTEFARYTVHSTMKELDRKLGNVEFVRVHRSFIARLDKIQSIDNQNVILENEKKIIPVGGSYREELMQKLNLL